MKSMRLDQLLNLYCALSELSQPDIFALQRALDNMTEQQQNAFAHILTYESKSRFLK